MHMECSAANANYFACQHKMQVAKPPAAQFTSTCLVTSSFYKHIKSNAVKGSHHFKSLAKIAFKNTTQLSNAHIPMLLKSEINSPLNNSMFSRELLILCFTLKSQSWNFANALLAQQLFLQGISIWNIRKYNLHPPPLHCHTSLERMQSCSITSLHVFIKRVTGFLTSVPKALCPQILMFCWVHILLKYPSWRCENTVSL